MEPHALPHRPAYTLTDITTYFLKLGTIGFGGPVALVGYMHRDLVEDRKWITEPQAALRQS
jgi:chromate transporter